jgi:hypothetical protein
MTAIEMELRPVVRVFAEAMEEKLRKNDHRGGWDVDDYEYIWRQLHEHLGKLTHHVYTDRARILPDAADVANLAMILCDILGVLPETAIATREVRHDSE